MRTFIIEGLEYTVGQDEAKRAVAVAVRNRWRRQQVSDPLMREGITGKNILRAGPSDEWKN